MINKRILFVDDEKAILSSLQRELRKTGYEVSTAASGEEALEILKMFSPQILVTDERMPDMGGIRLLQIVKELYPQIVRIMLSGYASTDSIIDAINKGEVFRFLTKPWNREDLLECLEQGFRRYEVIEETRLIIQPMVTQREQGVTSREARNHPLKITQTLINALCLPVLVIDWENSLGLINQEGKDLLKSSPEKGTPMADILGEAITDMVLQKMSIPGGLEMENITYNNTKFTLYIRAFRSIDPFKGAIILEKQKSGVNE